MRYIAVRMARQRIAALLAVLGAVLGGAALITGTGVLLESGVRSHLPPGRFSAAGVVVSADQTFRPNGDLPIALPERGPIPAALTGELARVPGVIAAVGDLSFPAAVIGAGGRVVPGDDPQVAGHGWASTGLIPQPRIDGRPPVGAGEVAMDAATAAAAGARPGDKVRVVAAGRSAVYRLSAVVGAPGAGILFADPTAEHLAGRDRGPRAATVDLVGLRTASGSGESVAAAVRDRLRGRGLVVATGAG